MNINNIFTKVLLDEINSLKKENEKLLHENFGLKNKIKNLEEKLYKRNESYKGEVWDKDPYKGRYR